MPRKQRLSCTKVRSGSKFNAYLMVFQDSGTGFNKESVELARKAVGECRDGIIFWGKENIAPWVSMLIAACAKNALWKACMIDNGKTAIVFSSRTGNLIVGDELRIESAEIRHRK